MPLELHSIEAGDMRPDSLPLVILHGLLGSADNWRSALKRFGSERRIIALDLRNHGRSPHAQGMNYLSLAEDVLHTLDLKGVQRFQLLGHSMGGKVAMALALHHPERVERLIVVDIAPLAYGHGHDNEFKAMQAVDDAQVESRREADEVMSQWLPDKATRQFIATNLQRDESGRLTWRVGLAHLVDDYAHIGGNGALEGQYAGPVLLVKGNRSPYVTNEGIDASKALFPHLTVESLEAGHWVHAECFDAFKEVVDTFITA